MTKKNVLRRRDRDNGRRQVTTRRGARNHFDRFGVVPCRRALDDDRGNNNDDDLEDE